MFPTPYAVGHHVWSAGPADEHNNVTDVYTPPLDRPGRRVPVIQIVVKVAEPALAGHDRVVTEADLFVLPGFRPGDGDVFDLPEGRFEVVGFEDCTRGFHGWKPGNVVKLRLVQG